MISNFSITSAMTTLGPLARSNLFLFEISNVPGGGFSAAEDIRFAAETATVPQSTNEPMITPWMNSEYKTPGITKYADISVALRVSELQNMRIYDSLYAWYKMIYDPETGIQQAPLNGSMSNAKISLLNYQGSVVKYWDVYHIFPKGFGGTPLDRGNPEKQVMTIEFAYTYAIMKKYSS